MRPVVYFSALGLAFLFIEIWFIEKAAFYLRQISSALSPANFLATNPELIKETFRENGENLVRGMQMLAEDIAAGKGELKIRQSDATKFKLGVDMASTPGKVAILVGC